MKGVDLYWLCLVTYEMYAKTYYSAVLLYLNYFSYRQTLRTLNMSCNCILNIDKLLRPN